MGMMERMMDFMMGRMSEGEKKEMMNQMVDNFFAEMTVDDKKEMMPKMMMGMMGGEEGGGMMGMMSKMGGGGKEMQMPMMPGMMIEMMPRCLTMMLPNIPKEDRIDFILKMVETLMKHGCADLSEEEESAFTARVMEKVKI